LYRLVSLTVDVYSSRVGEKKVFADTAEINIGWSGEKNPSEVG